MAEDSSEIVREVAESVAATNLKTLGDGPAFFQNMSYANSIAQQQAMNSISLALAGKVGESIISLSPSEGGADVAMLGQLMKGMQTTPPETGQG